MGAKVIQRDANLSLVSQCSTGASTASNLISISTVRSNYRSDGMVWWNKVRLPRNFCSVVQGIFRPHRNRSTAFCVVHVDDEEI